jgi:hypothetical protein
MKYLSNLVPSPPGACSNVNVTDADDSVSHTDARNLTVAPTVIVASPSNIHNVRAVNVQIHAPNRTKPLNWSTRLSIFDIPNCYRSL